MLLPERLPPRLNLVVRVRPPRPHLTHVGTGAATAGASAARREERMALVGRGDHGGARAELEWRVRRESHQGLGTRAPDPN